MKKTLILITILSILTFCGCGESEKASKEERQVDYTAFLNDLCKNAGADDILEFAQKDLDNNGVPELIVAKNGVNNITVYTFDGAVVEIGNRDFETGTTRLLFSDNPAYPGIVYFL